MTKDDVPTLDNAAGFADWKKLVKIWSRGQTIKIEQQASRLIMNMTGRAREHVIAMEDSQLTGDQAIKNITDELESFFKSDQTQDLFSAIDDFEKLKRGTDDIETYIMEFQRRYRKVTQLGLKDYPDALLAYRLLNQASLSDGDNQLVRATLINGVTFDLMKESLKRTFSSRLSVQTYAYAPETAVKQEPIFLTQPAYVPQREPSRHEYMQQMYQPETGSAGYKWEEEQDIFYAGRQRMHPSRYNHGNDQRRDFRFNPYAGRGRNEPRRPSPRKRSPKKTTCFICNEPGHLCRDCRFNGLNN